VGKVHALVCTCSVVHSEYRRRGGTVRRPFEVLVPQQPDEGGREDPRDDEMDGLGDFNGVCE
jgi:hypothetical protein